MTQARRTLVNPGVTPYYHCICRCVRRAFLCGFDEFSGRSYEHRKQWLVDRLALVARSFAIDVCAYAVMSNHYHLVVRLNPSAAEQWSDDEVIDRWRALYALPVLVARYCRGELESAAAVARARETIGLLRERLSDLAWFMRSLNEPLARQANAEDKCTGRFWEGRYKSQALLDEAALLTCMSYVDLNPVRAGVAATPEDSDFAAIQARIRAYAAEQAAAVDTLRDESSEHGASPVPLLAFAGNEHRDAPDGLPFCLMDYLELVDWSGRAVRDDKRGAIAGGVPPILQRLGIDENAWIKTLKRSDYPFQRLAGRVAALRKAAGQYGQRFFKGMSAANHLFPG